MEVVGSMTAPKEDWQGHGWDDHERSLLEAGRRMSFRAKLQWLEDAHALAKRLARQRRWMGEDGVIRERSTEQVFVGYAELMRKLGQ
jgi:hypothetical protein